MLAFNVSHMFELWLSCALVQGAMVDVKPGYVDKSAAGVMGDGKVDEDSTAEQDVDSRYYSRKTAFHARDKVRFARISS